MGLVDMLIPSVKIIVWSLDNEWLTYECEVELQERGVSLVCWGTERLKLYWGRKYLTLVAIVAKCFWVFILPVLEYCSPVLMSAATSHLSLLDRVVRQVSRLSGGSVSCDLCHRRKVASLSVFFKIDSLVDHPVLGLFPAQYVLRRPTRGTLAAHSRFFEMPRFRTVQFSRSFVLSCVLYVWNILRRDGVVCYGLFLKPNSISFSQLHASCGLILGVNTLVTLFFSSSILSEMDVFHCAERLIIGCITHILKSFFFRSGKINNFPIIFTFVVSNVHENLLVWSEVVFYATQNSELAIVQSVYILEMFRLIWTKIIGRSRFVRGSVSRHVGKSSLVGY